MKDKEKPQGHAVQDALEYAEGIINTVREPLIVLDEDLRVVTASRSFYQVFKVRVEETERQFIYDLGNRQWDIPKLRQLLEEIVPNNTALDNFEVEHDFPGIGKRIMLLNARRIPRPPERLRIILLAIEDITERKQAEEETKKYAEQLEAANKELEAFSYTVSHDLRTPALGIGGLARILAEKYSSHLDAKGQKFLNTIYSTTEQMRQLIDNLLAFSGFRHQEVTYSEIDMTKLAQDVSEDLRSVHDGRRLQLNVKPLPSARGDQAMIRQVFINLLSNAIKFTRRKKTAVVEIGCRIQAGLTIYYVKDNGVGFDTEYADKLFEVFTRLHPSNEFEGTGFGLAIVWRIIQRHGGCLWAEGKVNEGATFYFSLLPVL